MIDLASQPSQLHSYFRLLSSNFDIAIKPVNNQIPLHADLNLHRLQFPQFYLHGHFGPQIQGNPSLLLLLSERGDQGIAKPSASAAERHIQQSGVLVSLVEYWQGALAELGARVRNGEMAVVKIIYTNLLVRIPGHYIHSELAICGEVGVDAEVSDFDAVDRVFGDPGLEDQIQNATGNGDGYHERQ